MKLLEYLQKTENLKLHKCIFFVGTCGFQKELLRMSLFNQLSSVKSISSQWINIADQGVDIVCQNFEQPSLFAKSILYILDECNGLSTKQQQRLIKACLDSLNPTFSKLVYLPKIVQKNDIPSECIVESEPKKAGYLSLLTLEAMRVMGLPINKFLADQISDLHQSNPIQILSELQKLRLFLKPGQDNYVIQDVLPLFPKSIQTNFFGFLDGIGTRRIQRSLREVQDLKKSSQWEPTKLLITTKSHFRKLLDLKNWTYDPDELRLFQQSHKYLTSKSRKEKESLITSLREYYQERLNSEQFEKFQKQFKSDYYFSKLVFQQHYFSQSELTGLMAECSRLLSAFQLKKIPEEYSLHHFIFQTCHK